MAVPLTLSSVPAQTPYVQYIATSLQTVFPYPFEITQDADLVVLLNGAAQPTDGGYALSGQGTTGGGNVTFTTGLTAGTIVTFYRNISIARITQLSQNGTFFSANFNNEFNRIYLIMQQLQESLLPGGNSAFALMIPNSNSPQPTTLLTPANYANKYLAFDANGNPTPAVLTSTTLTGALVTGFIHPILAVETSAGASVVNTGLPVGYVDRYGTNTSPGSTDMSSALQAAINVALYSDGSGQQGYPVRFLAGAYAIATLPTFGVLTNVQIPLDIGGAGRTATQLYYTGAASPTAGFLFTLPSGSYAHDFTMACSSASKCGGISVDGTVTPATYVLIERVSSQMAGIGFQFKNTNTNVIRDCSHWADNGEYLIIPQTVTNGDISHGLYATGGFCHDTSAYDFRSGSSVNYASGQRGIKIDATDSLNFRIRGALLVNESPSSSHQVLELGANAGTSHIYGAEVIGIYHESGFLGIAGSTGSNVMNCTDGGMADAGGVSITVTQNSLDNTILTNVVTGSLNFDSSCNSNSMVGGSYGSLVDNSSGLNYYAPGWNRNAGAISATLNGNVTINAPVSGVAFHVTGTQTVAGGLGVNGAAAPTQPTGYGTPTGNARSSSFAASSITLANLAAEVAQLVIDLKATGVIAA